VPAVALDPDKTAEQIGRRIAELRQGKGWSQLQLADKLRATYQWVSQLEAGQNLTVHSLVKVANAFKVPLEELLVLPNPMNKRRGPGRPKKAGML
jgi:transcriptional regulator with XRE-family HTH domain